MPQNIDLFGRLRQRIYGQPQSSIKRGIDRQDRNDNVLKLSK